MDKRLDVLENSTQVIQTITEKIENNSRLSINSDSVDVENNTTNKKKNKNKKRNNNKNKTLQKTNDNDINQVDEVDEKSHKELVDAEVVSNEDTEKKSDVEDPPIVKETSEILENSNSSQPKETERKISKRFQYCFEEDRYKEDCLKFKLISPRLILDEDDKYLSTVRYTIRVIDPGNIRISEPDSTVEEVFEFFLDAQRQLMTCGIDINKWHKYVKNVKGNNYMKLLSIEMPYGCNRYCSWACLIISNVKDTDLDTYIDQLVDRLFRSSPDDDDLSPQYWANKFINRVLELKPDIEAKLLVNRINNVFRQNRLVYNTDELTTTNDILILRHIIDLIPKDSSYPSGFNSIPLLSRLDKQIYNPNSDVPHKDKYWHIGCLCASCNYHKRASDNYNYLIN